MEPWGEMGWLDSLRLVISMHTPESSHSAEGRGKQVGRMDSPISTLDPSPHFSTLYTLSGSARDASFETGFYNLLKTVGNHCFTFSKLNNELFLAVLSLEP